MKKYFYFLIFLLAGFSSKAQIVNNQFEDWTNVGAYDSLNNWSTDNFLASTCAQKDTVNPQSGSASLKLVTSSYVDFLTIALPGAASTGGFAVNGTTIDLSQGGQPDTVNHTYLKGYYNFNPVGSGVGSIEVVLYKRNGATRDTIASGIMSLTTATSSYTAFTVPLTYIRSGTPDSSIIYFESSSRNGTDLLNTATIGSTLYIDSIYFDGITGINELSSNLVSVSAFPNPASDFISIEAKWKTAVKSFVSVSDVNGKRIENIPMLNDKQRIDVSSLPSGNYLYELIDEKGTKLYSGKFSVNH